MNQIVSHELTKTDVENRLSLPSHALLHLPPFEGDRRAQDLTVKDEEGIEWKFLYRIREGPYKKPELSTNWLNFVRRKKLKIGDEIQFFKKEEATGGPTYMIKVMKKFTLMGNVHYLPYVPYVNQADR